MKNLKLNQGTEITYQEAKELIKGTELEQSFDNLNESTISNTQNFESVQNRSYFITKVGKKGTVLYKGTDFETRCEKGVFDLEMSYDYKHPTNFAQNANNLVQSFKISF